MRKKNNNLIIIIIGIIFLSSFTVFSNAADSSDHWGKKEGDTFTYKTKHYSNSSSYLTDCTGTIVITIASISADGTLTYNMSTTNEFSDDTTNPRPSSNNVTDYTTTRSISIYILSLSRLNQSASQWDHQAGIMTDTREREIASGDFNGTYSVTNDSLGYSFKLEGLLLSPTRSPLPPEYRVMTIQNVSSEATIRYKANGVLERSHQYSKIGDYYLMESSYILSENNIPGINVNTLLGFSIFSVIGLILIQRKKIRI